MSNQKVSKDTRAPKARVGIERSASRPGSLMLREEKFCSLLGNLQCCSEELWAQLQARSKCELWVLQGWLCVFVPSRCYFVPRVTVNYSQALAVAVAVHPNRTLIPIHVSRTGDPSRRFDPRGSLQSRLLHSAWLHEHFDSLFVWHIISWGCSVPDLD